MASAITLGALGLDGSDPMDRAWADVAEAFGIYDDIPMKEDTVCAESVAVLKAAGILERTFDLLQAHVDNLLAGSIVPDFWESFSTWSGPCRACTRR
jgi:hypothetical protein